MGGRNKGWLRQPENALTRKPRILRGFRFPESVLLWDMRQRLALSQPFLGVSSLDLGRLAFERPFFVDDGDDEFAAGRAPRAVKSRRAEMRSRVVIPRRRKAANPESGCCGSSFQFQSAAARN